jgi:hypothetical protein
MSVRGCQVVSLLTTRHRTAFYAHRVSTITNFKAFHSDITLADRLLSVGCIRSLHSVQVFVDLATQDVSTCITYIKNQLRLTSLTVHCQRPLWPILPAQALLWPLGSQHTSCLSI